MFNILDILYPINLDSDNISPVVNAVEIAKKFNSRLHILYVNDLEAGYRHPTDREDAVALRVEEVVPPEILGSVNIIFAVAKGKLDKEVNKYCKNNNINMIITGHKHKNKLYSMLFDTPDENIIDAINLPVLVLPKK